MEEPVAREGLVRTLLELLAIDSPPLGEKALADHIAARFQNWGFEVRRDDVGSQLGGTSGNLLVTLPGIPHPEPLLLVAHLDTVPEAVGVRPRIEGDLCCSSGETVLGGDDKAGIAIILETIETLVENRIPHPPIEILFTVAEECGLLGIKHFNARRLKARHAIVMDGGLAQNAIVAAPALRSFRFRISGRLREEGVSELADDLGGPMAIAARAIAAAPFGRIQSETSTAITSLIGTERTIEEPSQCSVEGYAKSTNLRALDASIQAICAAFRLAVEGACGEPDDPVHYTLAQEVHADYPGFHLPQSSPLRHRILQAAQGIGFPLNFTTGRGGSDANILPRYGIHACVLGTGVRLPHTLREYVDLREMTRLVQLLVEILRTW